MSRRSFGAGAVGGVGFAVSFELAGVVGLALTASVFVLGVAVALRRAGY